MSRRDRGFDIAIVILCFFLAFTMLSAMGAFNTLGSSGVESGGDIDKEYGEGGDSSEAVVESAEQIDEEESEGLIERWTGGFSDVLAPVQMFLSGIGFFTGAISDLWMLTSIFPGPMAWGIRVVISASLVYSVIRIVRGV